MSMSMEGINFIEQILTMEYLLSKSSLSHLGVWIYGIICFVSGIGFYFIINYVKKSRASLLL